MGGDVEYREKLRAMGAEIRARRESLGMSIEDASADTKLRTKYLSAVEAGDDTQAPGTTYFKAFLKTYSAFLGLDGTSYSRAYQSALEERDTPPPRTRPKSDVPRGMDKQVPEARGPRPTSPKRTEVEYGAAQARAGSQTQGSVRRPRKRGVSIWAVLLVLAVAAAAYYAYTVLGASPPPEPPVAVDPGSEPEPEPDPVPVEPLKPPAPQVVKTEIDAENVAFTVDRSPVELTIRTATEEDSYCWVRARVDGELLFEKTLSPGQEEKITGSSEIYIRAGKPWAITLVVNGQDQGVAGEYGPVKDITVTATP